MLLALKTDTDVSDIILLEPSGQVIAKVEWRSERRLADELLTKIGKALRQNSLDWRDLSGLIVFKGPGSFTGLRIGATTANAIAFVNNIPIVGASGDGWAKDGVERLRKKENDKQVLPSYGSDPNITKPNTSSA